MSAGIASCHATKVVSRHGAKESLHEGSPPNPKIPRHFPNRASAASSQSATPSRLGRALRGPAAREVWSCDKCLSDITACYESNTLSQTCSKHSEAFVPSPGIMHGWAVPVWRDLRGRVHLSHSATVHRLQGICPRLHRLQGDESALRLINNMH